VKPYGCASLHATVQSILRLLCGALVFVLVPSVTFGQDATEPSLKAALIFNFARFTVWPEDALPANTPFMACVVADSATSQAFDRTVKGRLLAGHPITVIRPGPDASLQKCHLLYVVGSGPAQIARLIEEVRAAPVLTIVDTESTLTEPIVRVFVENGRMRFDLDNRLARRNRLQLSSKILTLASRLKDEPGQVTR
jgi:hypothetical protein